MHFGSFPGSDFFHQNSLGVKTQAPPLLMRLTCTAQRTWMIANKKSTGDEGVIDTPCPPRHPPVGPVPTHLRRSGADRLPVLAILTRAREGGHGALGWRRGLFRGGGCFVHSQACRTMPRFNNWFPAGFFPCCSWAIRTIHLCPLLVNPQQLSAGHDGWMTIHRWHKLKWKLSPDRSDSTRDPD